MALHNWAGSFAFSTSDCREPSSVAGLQQLVAESDTVRALGSRHSFSRVADTTGTLVGTGRLTDVAPTLDAASGEVTVPSGATFAAVADFLDGTGRALANLGSLPHISVAGACATGTHGSGAANRCLAAAATAIEIVRADGELMRCAAGDADFGGAVLALGALGVATSVTLSTVPAFEVRQDVWLDADLPAVLDDLDAVLGAAYSVSLFSTLRSGVVDKLWFKSALPGPVPDGTRWGATPANTPVHPIDGEDTGATTEQLGAPGPWSARLPHFRAEFTPSSGDEQQSEYLVDRGDAVSALRAVHAAAPDIVPALQVAEFRLVAADDLWLSPCHGRDTFALHFTWRPSDELVRAAVGAVEAALAPFAPRPHWGKVFALDPAGVRRHYPRLRDFGQLAAAHDPGRKFGNEFLRTYVY